VRIHVDILDAGADLLLELEKDFLDFLFGLFDARVVLKIA
jgi:hypothetical protein